MYLRELILKFHMDIEYIGTEYYDTINVLRWLTFLGSRINVTLYLVWKILVCNYFLRPLLTEQILEDQAGLRRHRVSMPGISVKGTKMQVKGRRGKDLTRPLTAFCWNFFFNGISTICPSAIFLKNLLSCKAVSLTNNISRWPQEDILRSTLFCIKIQRIACILICITFILEC